MTENKNNDEFLELLDSIIEIIGEWKEAHISEVQKSNSIPEVIDFKNGETAWYVSSDGALEHVRHDGIKGRFDINHRFFKSLDMAEEFRRKSQFIADALYWKQLFDADYVPDLGDTNEVKYYVAWSTSDEKFCAMWTQTYRAFDVVFSTFDIAKSFADWLNDRKESENGD